MPANAPQYSGTAAWAMRLWNVETIAATTPISEATSTGESPASRTPRATTSADPIVSAKSIVRGRSPRGNARVVWMRPYAAGTSRAPNSTQLYHGPPRRRPSA